MWSLPDIKRLNEEAVKESKHLEYCAKNLINPETGEKAVCQYHDNGECRGKLTPVMWKDVFSDDYKGLFFLCDEHYGYYDNPDEGFFYCDNCGEAYIKNYSWENYYTIIDDEMLCLNCGLDKVMEDEDYWITHPDELTWDLVRSAPHVIPVEGEYWKDKLEFIGNVEFDSMSGEKLYGTRESGMADLRELVRKGIRKYGKVILILDAVYQFAVSIGVYGKKGDDEEE